MNIEKTLTELGDYFKQKLINGEFEFISCNEYTAKIIIDDKKLAVWIAGEVKDYLEFYYEHMFTTIHFEDLKFTNQKDRIKAYRTIKPMIISYKNDILMKQKKAELKQITNEIKKLSKWEQQ